jgi:hypothetical protein
MADTLIFEVQATSKGLKVVQKDTKALADQVERTNTARDKAGKSQDNYNRREKGIAQSNLSSAKGFSKMNQTLGGSSGLVGAYATLAANVFAATAAFNALRRAAQLEQLVAGLELVGAAAGRNLTYAADKLREVSGFAISTDQAMRNMALGISAGFDTTQMEGLTRVARGASIALGRDMGDAMDRLTRGAAKLEPEILDELGIMVRLDQATEDYATSLEKPVTALSQFERRQAFLNAILEQGEKKFGTLADSIKPSSYDKLAASLGNLVKILSNLINKGLGPVVELLSNNMAALTSVLILFGSTITRQLLPGLSNMAKGAAQAAASTASTANAQLGQLKTTEKMPDAYSKATKAMQNGSITQKQYAKAQRSLTQSNLAHQRNIDADPVKYAKGTAAMKTKEAAMRTNKIAMADLTNAYRLHQIAQAQSTAASSVEAAQNGQFILGAKLAAQAVREYTATTMQAAVGTGVLNTALAGAKVAFVSTAMVAKTAGASIMASLGWISLVASAAFMLYEVFKDKLWPEDPIEEEAKSIIESLESVKDTATSFQETMDTISDPAHVAVAGYKALTGVITELQSAMLGFARMSIKAQDEQTAGFDASIKEQQAILDAATEDQEGLHWFWDRTAYSKAAVAIQAANKEIEGLVEERDANIADKAKQRTENLVGMVGKATEGLKSQEGMEEFAALQITQLDALSKKISDGLITDPDKIKDEMRKILSPVATIQSAFDGAKDAAAQFAKETNKLAQKDKTPFDKSIEAAEGMQRQLDDIEKAYAGMGGEGELPANLQKQQDMLEKALSEQMGIDVTIGDKDAIDTYVETLNKNRETIISTKESVKKLNDTHKLTKNIVKSAGTVDALKAQLNIEEKIRTTKLAGIQATIENTIMLRKNAVDSKIKAAREAEDTTLLATLTAERAEIEEDIGDLRVEETRLTQAALDSGVRAAKIDQQRLQHAKELLGFQKKMTASLKADLASRQQIFKNQQLLAVASDPRRLRTTGVETTEGENLKAFYKFQNERRDLILQEYDLKIATINMEEALMRAKIEIVKAELRAAIEKGTIEKGTGNDILASLGAAPAAMEKASAAARRAAASARDAALTGLQVEEKKARLSARNELVASAGGAETVALNVRNMQEHWKGLREAAVEKIGQDGIEIFKKGNPAAYALAGAEELKMVADQHVAAIGEEGVKKAMTEDFGMKEKIEMMKNMTAPLIEQLKALGPEGELAASVAQGALIVADAWTTAGESFKDSGMSMQTGADIASAVASSMTAISGIMASASKARISAIDQEIAAEKKRDGKSAASIAKLKGLEKKKEKEKRKAFEQNKKMQMATIIANTAASIMQVWANPADITKGWAIAMTAVIAAMGAAQLAIVSGTSYQGGGSGSAGAMPSKVSVGERSNKVDLGKSAGGGGELAYLRGEKGIGSSASDFRPGAFAGKRYRAAGGTAYVVGEQGPELFLPEVPGQIVPNDRAGSMGAPMNVSFQVSAIDSTNMQDMLTTQRGNIISMIREAANSHGTGFLEGVDTSTYDAASGGGV